MPVADQVLQLAQVQAQPADDRLGNLQLVGGLSGLSWLSVMAGIGRLAAEDLAVALTVNGAQTATRIVGTLPECGTVRLQREVRVRLRKSDH